MKHRFRNSVIAAGIVLTLTLIFFAMHTHQQGSTVEAYKRVWPIPATEEEIRLFEETKSRHNLE